jgi:hypothetical protein
MSIEYLWAEARSVYERRKKVAGIHTHIAYIEFEIHLAGACSDSWYNYVNHNQDEEVENEQQASSLTRWKFSTTKVRHWSGICLI